jgi:uncharacterized protein (DUF362 family)
MLDRRAFVLGSGAAAGAAWMLSGCGGRAPGEPVVIARAERYDGELVSILKRGLAEIGIDRDRIRDRSVMLKPNLVEPSESAPHINTHPLLIAAAAEAFRSLDAAEVFVAEGQGHCRDSYLVLEQSGLATVLEESRIPFVDLNHDEFYGVPNRIQATGLSGFGLPTTLRRADVIVSMPKLKTHHWVGVTLSMKNLFGVLPGILYGWPKNLLHQVGIDRSIIDITAAVRPHLAIVDGIVGMEGDGPIMGEPRQANLLVMGANPVAVDAIGARLMGFDPVHIPYLASATEVGLGPIEVSAIDQRGESIASLAQRFEILDHPSIQRFRPV